MAVRRGVTATALGALLFLGSGCGSGAPVSSTSGDDTPTVAPRSSTAARPTDPTHLRGRLERSTEGSCIRLVSDGVAYELLGATDGLVLGREASLEGHVDRTVAAVCGSGVPFVVTRVDTSPSTSP
jgi:hypothetical protein